MCTGNRMRNTMEPIQMVDLRRQYRKIAAEIDTRWADILNAASFIQGPDVQRFSSHLAEYLSVKHVVPCGNGTDALQAAMMALDLQPGDEVITTDFTFVATAEVIALLRLTPVLVDACPDTFNIDPAAVERAVTPRTKAIVPVHLFGQCAPMAEILDIAQRHGLYVIEDACQAMGAEYVFPDGRRCKAGTMGEIGCTSFFPSKNLGCYGDGGALFTQDDRLAEKLRQVVNHGMKVRYHHDEIGCNSRLDTLQAAVLDVKLPHLDSYNEARRRAADFYDRALAGCRWLKLPYRAPYATHVFHQYTVRLDGSVNRAALQEALKEAGIPAMVYYPVPLHRQKAYRDTRYKDEDFPVTEQLCERVLSLPMHTELDEEQLHYITENLLRLIETCRR